METAHHTSTTRYVLALLGTLVLSAGPQVHACDKVSFVLADQLQLGGPSLNLVVADFNADSNADVAATNDQGVVIYLGDGAGHFGSATTFSAGILPRAIVAGDLDGDGKADLVVGNYTDVSVLINDGQGGFKGPVDYPVEGYPIALALGDFNNDGTPDLAIANNDANNVFILRGDGAGHFGEASNVVAGLQPYALAVADLNQDGKLDLAVSTYGAQALNILMGNGRGEFNHGGSYPLTGNGSRVVIADFNNDSHLDVAVGVFNIYPNNHIAVFLGDGTGNFVDATEIPAYDPQGLAVADFDGDGNLDVAATLYSIPALVLALGDGSGTFGAPQRVRLPLHPLPFALSTADFNNDGSSDLVTGNYGNGELDVLLNLPTVEIWASDPTASQSGDDHGRFQVRRLGCNDLPLTVSYSVGGTAVGGTDYRALKGTVTIPSGLDCAGIGIAPANGTLNQSATVTVTLTPQSYYAVGASNTAVVTIEP